MKRLKLRLKSFKLRINDVTNSDFFLLGSIFTLQRCNELRILNADCRRVADYSLVQNLTKGVEGNLFLHTQDFQTFFRRFWCVSKRPKIRHFAFISAYQRSTEKTLATNLFWTNFMGGSSLCLSRKFYFNSIRPLKQQASIFLPGKSQTKNRFIVKNYYFSNLGFYGEGRLSRRKSSVFFWELLHQTYLKYTTNSLYRKYVGWSFTRIKPVLLEGLRLGYHGRVGSTWTHDYRYPYTYFFYTPVNFFVPLSFLSFFKPMFLREHLVTSFRETPLRRADLWSAFFSTSPYQKKIYRFRAPRPLYLLLIVLLYWFNPKIFLRKKTSFVLRRRFRKFRRSLKRFAFARHGRAAPVRDIADELEYTALNAHRTNFLFSLQQVNFSFFLLFGQLVLLWVIESTYSTLKFSIFFQANLRFFLWFADAILAFDRDWAVLQYIKALLSVRIASGLPVDPRLLLFFSYNNVNRPIILFYTIVKFTINLLSAAVDFSPRGCFIQMFFIIFWRFTGLFYAVCLRIPILSEFLLCANYDFFRWSSAYYNYSLRKLMFLLRNFFFVVKAFFTGLFYAVCLRIPILAEFVLWFNYEFFYLSSAGYSTRSLRKFMFFLRSSFFILKEFFIGLLSVMCLRIPILAEFVLWFNYAVFYLSLLNYIYYISHKLMFLLRNFFFVVKVFLTELLFVMCLRIPILAGFVFWVNYELFVFRSLNYSEYSVHCAYRSRELRFFLLSLFLFLSTLLILDPRDSVRVEKFLRVFFFCVLVTGLIVFAGLFVFKIIASFFFILLYFFFFIIIAYVFKPINFQFSQIKFPSLNIKSTLRSWGSYSDFWLFNLDFALLPKLLLLLLIKCVSVFFVWIFNVALICIRSLICRVYVFRGILTQIILLFYFDFSRAVCYKWVQPFTDARRFNWHRNPLRFTNVLIFIYSELYASRLFRNFTVSFVNRFFNFCYPNELVWAYIELWRYSDGLFLWWLGVYPLKNLNYNKSLFLKLNLMLTYSYDKSDYLSLFYPVNRKFFYGSPVYVLILLKRNLVLLSDCVRVGLLLGVTRGTLETWLILCADIIAGDYLLVVSRNKIGLFLKNSIYSKLTGCGTVSLKVFVIKSLIKSLDKLRGKLRRAAAFFVRLFLTFRLYVDFLLCLSIVFVIGGSWGFILKIYYTCLKCYDFLRNL